MIAWLLVLSALAASVTEGERCLRANDVVCAEEVVAALDAENSSDADTLVFAARTAFFRGDHARAAELSGKARRAGYQEEHGELSQIEATAAATEEWTRAERGKWRAAYAPGLDAVLVDDAIETVRLSEAAYSPVLGSGPPGGTVVELYPEPRSFTAASGLPRSAIETTGVVAISKWARLLVMSPRTRALGYTWQDTIAHEYVHLVVAHQTDDHAPVWLQEAIAKYLDNRWRDGRDNFRLSVRQESLLADALANDSLVPFEKMHPSLALLDSQEEAALAYAQLASLMHYCFETSGEDVLLRTLPRVKRGEDPRVALADEVGAKNFDALLADWRAWIGKRGLVAKKLEELNPVLAGGEAEDVDPVLAKRKDLAGFVRLGDMLLERDRPLAALTEYEKAQDPDEPHSPLLANRLAEAHLQLGQPREARAALEKSLEDYPEFGMSHKTLGDIARSEGRSREAYAAYLKAVEINPFDPELQSALGELAEALGDANEASRRGRYLQIIKRGGEG
ncbi:MAG: tetratricopeptide repeat protein [Deltaproteobacteria bacterium]|nr:MAG: tetratricopeptide repeat protein [Deltaproteobacteria bacterium]